MFFLKNFFIQSRIRRAVLPSAGVAPYASARKTADAAAQAARAGEKGFDLAAALDALPPGDLANLTFVEGELDVLARRVNNTSVVLALHGAGGPQPPAPSPKPAARPQTAFGFVDRINLYV